MGRKAGARETGKPRPRVSPEGLPWPMPGTVVPTDWTGEPDSRSGSRIRSGMTPGRWSLGNLARRGASRDWPQRRRDLDRTEKREFVAGLHDALTGVAMVVVTQNKGL